MEERVRPKADGFTLIELLVVIAIILILIAIALPNFMDTMIRARVVRAKSEIRSLALAMEAYHLDWEDYPSFSYPNYSRQWDRRKRGLTWLTSPIVYIARLPEDPFPGEVDSDGVALFGPPYSYILDGVRKTSEEEMGGQLNHPVGFNEPGGTASLVAWALYSLGPDSPVSETRPDHHESPIFSPSSATIYTYSPTNGTRSRGDIMLYGGEARWMGVVAGFGRYAVEDRYEEFPHEGQKINDVVYLHRFPPGP